MKVFRQCLTCQRQRLTVSLCETVNNLALLVYINQSQRKKVWHCIIFLEFSTISCGLHSFFVFQRKNEGFHLGGLTNEFEDSFAFCQL